MAPLEETSTQQQRSMVRVLTAIESMKRGEMVIMVDDEDRENEGDLVFAAQFANSEKVNFMAREARGLICLPLEPSIVEQLKLPLMDDATKGPGDHTTAFTVSIEARRGVTTGISAADRARTILAASSHEARPDDLVVPGHIFPLKAKQGGVLERSGHTEGSVDLVRLAGLRPAAVICEIMNDDGTMARMQDLEAFAKKHAMPIVSIEDIISYRLMRDSLVRLIDSGVMQTPFGNLQMNLYESSIDSCQHLTIMKNPELFATTVVDVRVHRQRPITDVFALGIKGQNPLDYGMKLLEDSECAAVLYLSQNARDLMHSDFSDFVFNSDKQTDERTTKAAPHVGMDYRQLGVGAQILRSMGVQRMKVHATTPKVLVGLAGFGLEVTETVIIPTV